MYRHLFLLLLKILSSIFVHKLFKFFTFKSCLKRLLIVIKVYSSALVIYTLYLIHHLFMPIIILTHHYSHSCFQLCNRVQNINQIQILVYLFDSFLEDNLLIKFFMFSTMWILEAIVEKVQVQSHQMTCEFIFVNGTIVWIWMLVMLLLNIVQVSNVLSHNILSIELLTGLFEHELKNSMQASDASEDGKDGITSEHMHDLLVCKIKFRWI